MANLGVVESEINRLPAEYRTALLNAFREVLKMRLGRATHGTPSENLVGGFFDGVTASVAGTEFSIAHSFGRVPYMAQQVIRLSAGRKDVPLTVTKDPDARRVYFSSTLVDAPFTVYLEA